MPTDFVHSYLPASSVAECSERSSADGSAGNITAGYGLVKDRLPGAVPSVKRDTVSHRQVRLVFKLN